VSGANVAQEHYDEFASHAVHVPVKCTTLPKLLADYSIDRLDYFQANVQPCHRIRLASSQGT
jgi:hypothetical protein